MLINILNPYDKGKSISENQSECINWYMVEDDVSGKYPVNAYPTPGSILIYDAGAGETRAMFEHHGVLYTVIGNKFTRITSDGQSHEIGSLDSSTGHVYLASIDNQIVMIDGVNGHHYNTTTTTFQQILDVDFVSNATGITSQDGYFILTKPSSNQFFISALSNGLSYDALDFSSITGDSDQLVTIASNHRELWLFGSKTIEIWINSGNVDFPFERRNDTTYLHYGCSAKSSVVTGDNTLFFLGSSQTGGHVVVRIDGYHPKVISNRGINYQISQMTTVSDAFAYMYQWEGHEFYVITFPTGNKTFVYDVSTGMWHQWSYNGITGRHHSNCFAFCYNKLWIGDYNAKKYYTLDYNIYKDDSVDIQRQVTTPPIYNEGRLTNIDRLQIDWEPAVGTNPAQTTSVSKDNGFTYTALTPSRNLGSVTDYTKRIVYDRLGQARCWNLRINTSMNAKAILLGAFMHGMVGEH